MNSETADDVLKRPPPPRKGDVLFRGNLPDWHNNACLNYMRGGDQWLYAEGYWRAAKTLVEHVLQSRSDQDVLVYPIIFLYRHHIELVLKRLILRAPYLIERRLTEAEKQHLGKHRLDLLWQDLKPMLVTICEAADWELDPEDVDGIEDYIAQLVKLDPDSYSFRYAHSKQGTPSLPEDLTHINLRHHFGDMMDHLADYFSGIEAGVDHLEEMQQDWYSDLASYMDC